AAFGADAGQRVSLESDPQALRAVGVLPDAKRLVEAVRNGTPISWNFIFFNGLRSWMAFLNGKSPIKSSSKFPLKKRALFSLHWERVRVRDYGAIPSSFIPLPNGEEIVEASTSICS